MDREALAAILGDRPVAYHPIIAKVFGSAKAALFLSQLLYWHGKGKYGDWTYKTAKDFWEETGLSRKEQKTARTLLKKRGVLEEKLAGVPATLHFRVNLDKLIEAVSLYERGKLDLPKGDSKADQSGQTIPEITQENTQEITSENAPSAKKIKGEKANGNLTDPTHNSGRDDDRVADSPSGADHVDSDKELLEGYLEGMTDEGVLGAAVLPGPVRLGGDGPADDLGGPEIRAARIGAPDFCGKAEVGGSSMPSGRHGHETDGLGRQTGGADSVAASSGRMSGPSPTKGGGLSAGNDKSRGGDAGSNSAQSAVAQEGGLTRSRPPSKLPWGALPPETVGALYLEEHHGYWHWFRDRDEKRDFEMAERSLALPDFIGLMDEIIAEGVGAAEVVRAVVDRAKVFKEGDRRDGQDHRTESQPKQSYSPAAIAALRRRGIEPRI